MNLKSLFNELRRRNIYKVAIAYGITGWVIVQVASIAADTFGAPGWVMKMIITAILLGFPVALIFAWAFEITPEGIKRTHEVSKEKSIATRTGQKLNYWIIGLLSAGMLFLLVDRFGFNGTNTLPPLTAKAEAIPSVAVLPFQDFSAGGDQEWFSDGLTEELLNSLARLQGLQVAARTSSFHFKNKNIPIQQIADTLGVEHIVEGSVRRADNNMRITAQLIRASDGFHLWSQTYDRSADDIFNVQEDISENIASALNVYLDDKERDKMFAFGTRNVEAYNAYLKGRNVYDKLHTANIDSNLFAEASPWFEKAIALDPEFAAPYYFLADPYTHYILRYPELKIDSLSLQKAEARTLRYLNEAIHHTSDPGQQLMYRFERTFLSADWSEIPVLVKKLKTSPEAQRAYTMIGGGWTRSFLNAIGRARLQYRLTQEAIQRDPLDNGLKGSSIQALMSYAPADTLFAVAKKFEEETGRHQDPGSYYFVYTFNRMFQKADSIANTVSTDPTHPFNIFSQAVRGDTAAAKENFEKLPNEGFKNALPSAYFHYALGDIAKANDIVIRVDTTALGPQKLLITFANNSGGFLPFSVDSMPALGKLFRQAQTRVEPYTLGSVKIPRIVQKELK